MKNTAKKCKALTKKKIRCSKSVWGFRFCKQHWKLKIFSWWSLFWLILISLGAAFGFYVDGKQIVKEIETVSEPEPDYVICEQDGNIRGIILDKIYLKNSKTLNLHIGTSKEKNKTIFTRNIRKNYYQCLFPKMIDEDCNLKFRIDKNNTLMLTFDLYDEYNCLVGKIKDNKFILNLDCQFTWNMDERGFEVIDNDFNVVISVDYKPLDKLRIQGIVPHERGIGYFFDTRDIKGASIGIIDYQDKKLLQEVRGQLKPIFDYYGKDYFGKRASSE